MTVVMALRLTELGLRDTLDKLEQEGSEESYRDAIYQAAELLIEQDPVALEEAPREKTKRREQQKLVRDAIGDLLGVRFTNGDYRRLLQKNYDIHPTC